MIRDLVSFIRAVETFASENVSELAEPLADGTFVHSTSPEFYHNATLDQMERLQDIESSAAEVLLDGAGLVNEQVKNKLKAKGMEVVRLPVRLQPLVYGLKTHQFTIPLCFD